MLFICSQEQLEPPLSQVIESMRSSSHVIFSKPKPQMHEPFVYCMSLGC